jgi:hypothetical protein
MIKIKNIVKSFSVKLNHFGYELVSFVFRILYFRSPKNFLLKFYFRWTNLKSPAMGDGPWPIHILPEVYITCPMKFGRTENLFDPLTQCEILRLCRLDLNRLKFYRTKTWDIRSKSQISASLWFIEKILSLTQIRICFTIIIKHW